jgi:hypothetical protein
LVVWVIGFAGLLAHWFVSGHYFIEFIWLPWSLVGGFAIAFASLRRPLFAVPAGLGLAAAAAASLSLVFRYEQRVATRLAEEVLHLLQFSEASGASFELDCPARDAGFPSPTEVELRDFTLGSWIFVLKAPGRSLGLDLRRGESGRWQGQCYDLPAA